MGPGRTAVDNHKTYTHLLWCGHIFSFCSYDWGTRGEVSPADWLGIISNYVLGSNLQYTGTLAAATELYSWFLLHLNIEYCVTMCGKYFLWVELHRNDRVWTMQEYGSHAGTLRECHICRTLSVIIHTIRSVQTQLQLTVVLLKGAGLQYCCIPRRGWGCNTS